jgi:hypothetical protein
MCAVLLELSAAAAIAEFGNSRCVREYMKKFSLINLGMKISPRKIEGEEIRGNQVQVLIYVLISRVALDVNRESSDM